MRVVIFGAGQAGQMAARWMRADHTLLAYADNSPARWNTRLDGVPVLPPAQAAALRPDEIWIAVLKREAEPEIRRQLAGLGYAGPVRSVGELRGWMDIRLAQLRLLADQLEQDGVPGAVAELGVYQGEMAAELNRLFPNRPLYLFDTFRGFDPADLQEEESAPPAGFLRYQPRPGRAAPAPSGAGHLLRGAFSPKHAGRPAPFCAGLCGL